MTFSLIDVFFVFVIVAFALTAAAKGLVAEFFGKASLLVGLGTAVFLYRWLSSYVVGYVSNAFAARVISFLLIFITAYLIVKIIQHIIANIFSSEILGGLDHALGFLFGAAEGIVVVVLIIILLFAQPWIPAAKILDHSFFATLFSAFVTSPVNYVQGIFA